MIAKTINNFNHLAFVCFEAINESSCLNNFIYSVKYVLFINYTHFLLRRTLAGGLFEECGKRHLSLVFLTSSQLGSGMVIHTI